MCCHAIKAWSFRFDIGFLGVTNVASASYLLTKVHRRLFECARATGVSYWFGFRIDLNWFEAKMGLCIGTFRFRSCPALLNTSERSMNNRNSQNIWWFIRAFIFILIQEREEKRTFKRFCLCQLKLKRTPTVEKDMAPKKVKATDTSLARFIFRNFINELVRLVLYVICSFYLFLVCYTGEGIYTVLQVFFGLIREVLKILLALAARIVSEICFGAALIMEKIVGAILHLLLLLIVKAGSLINQATRELVLLAGYGVSSAVFITITVVILWFLVPVLEEIGHVILRLNTVTWRVVALHEPSASQSQPRVTSQPWVQHEWPEKNRL